MSHELTTRLCSFLVVTTKALKYNGGLGKTQWDHENLTAFLATGIENLGKHIENLKNMVFRLLLQ